jgi:hypothetical protein
VRDELQDAVAALEAAQVFPHRAALWEALAQTPWARGRGLTAAALKARARKLAVRVGTPKAGHRFRSGQDPQGIGTGTSAAAPGPSAGPGEGTPRGSAEDRRRRRFSLPVLRAEAPARFHHLVDRAEGGSLRASIDLKCLDCSAWQPAEVRQCPVTDCPLYPVRPYRP